MKWKKGTNFLKGKRKKRENKIIKLIYTEKRRKKMFQSKYLFLFKVKGGRKEKNKFVSFTNKHVACKKWINYDDDDEYSINSEKLFIERTKKNVIFKKKRRKKRNLKEIINIILTTHTHIH